jgi:hypothetical protein
LSYTLQLDAIERETLAVVGAIATAKIQGADIDVPTLAEARTHFNTWLLSDDDDGDDSDDAVLKRALGLRKG